MSTRKKEFGDFQTPAKLSQQICRLLSNQGIFPNSIIEPTCGKGSFIWATVEHFPQAKRFFGVDINSNHIDFIRQKLNQQGLSDKVNIIHSSFFDVNWQSILDELPQPLLIVGNPPWITNSALGVLNSQNLPKKTNLNNYSGLDALTGKSNFDISEWMLSHLLQLMRGKEAVLAMLIKTSVARKLLKRLWGNGAEIGQAHIYLLDGKREFGVSVDMGLFVCKTGGKSQSCNLYDGLNPDAYLTSFGFRDGHLVANLKNYEQYRHLTATNSDYRWRSGIKHDAAKLMELTKHPTFYTNGLNETCVLEKNYLYPLLKSSDIAKGLVEKPRRWVIVPQSSVGESTAGIRDNAPKTWVYLHNHKPLFDKRKSSVYKGKPDFSIFGVGAYSFAPWKVAISGLYKSLKFAIVGSYEGKPIILDDTCYFLPCDSEDEANFLLYLLTSQTAKQFFATFIFWDAKRPITANILGKLSLSLLAKELGIDNEVQILKTSQSYAKPTRSDKFVTELTP